MNLYRCSTFRGGSTEQLIDFSLLQLLRHLLNLLRSCSDSYTLKEYGLLRLHRPDRSSRRHIFSRDAPRTRQFCQHSVASTKTSRRRHVSRRQKRLFAKCLSWALLLLRKIQNKVFCLVCSGISEYH